MRTSFVHRRKYRRRFLYRRSGRQRLRIGKHQVQADQLTNADVADSFAWQQAQQQLDRAYSNYQQIVTETNIILTMPIEPTTKEIDAIAASKIAATRCNRINIFVL